MFIIYSFFIALLMVCNLADAAEAAPDLLKLELEELMEIKVAVVYGASKFEQKVTEAPASVSIITSDEIKKYGYRTLADILKSVRGFYVNYDRNYHYAGIRGFARPGDYSTRFLLLVDGHRINDNVYNQAAIGTDFILDVDIIERVEVIRGPGSSLYGSNAFLGVINVITKRGRNIGKVEASGEGRSFETYKGRLTYGNQFKNGLEILLSGSAYDTQGQDLYFKEFDDPATNNGSAENRDYDRYHSLFSNLSFKDFTFQSAYVSRKKGIPTASFSTIFNDSRAYTVDEHGYFDIKYEQTFDNGDSGMARLFYDWYNYKGDYPLSTALNKDFGWGKWWGGELKFIKKFYEHKLILGTEYLNNFRQDQLNYDIEPYNLYLDDKRDSDLWALYIQTEPRILNNLLLNLGVRHDYYETFGGSTNPRFALIYNPYKKTWLKFLYGQAFRAPNNYELYYTDGSTSKPNPNLQPEIIRTYEIIWEQYIGEYILVSASGFYYRIKDLITQQTDPADGLMVYRNTGEVEAKGMELELEHRLHNGIRNRVSYSYQDARNVQPESRLTNSPRHLAKFNLLVPLKKEKLFSGLEVQYTDKRGTLAEEQADAFFVTNLTLSSHNFVKGLEASVSIYNLFDKKYGNPASEEHTMDIIEQDGRSFRMKLTYRF